MFVNLIVQFISWKMLPNNIVRRYIFFFYKKYIVNLLRRVNAYNSSVTPVVVYSHLMGIFYRTIRMIDNGIKPVYVFDGKPPSMKSGEVSCEEALEREEIWIVDLQSVRNYIQCFLVII